MPVGAESLKRTAKSVAAPKKQTTAKTKAAKVAEAGVTNTDAAKNADKEAAKQEKATKAEKKTSTTKITKTVKNEETVYTSGIKCELPIHLL